MNKAYWRLSLKVGFVHALTDTTERIMYTNYASRTTSGIDRIRVTSFLLKRKNGTGEAVYQRLYVCMYKGGP
jgi:hypothetical protein